MSIWDVHAFTFNYILIRYVFFWMKAQPDMAFCLSFMTFCEAGRELIFDHQAQ